MGGGPNTPPESTWTNLSSRSSDDLVEVYNDPQPEQSTAQTTSNLSNLSLDPLSSSSSQSLFNTASQSDQGQGRLAELLWSKSAVYLHPNAYGKDKLPGFLSVVRIKEDEGSSLAGDQTRWNHFVSWIPEQLVQGTSDFDAYVLVELSSQNERDILVHLAPPFPESSSTSPAFPSNSPSAHAFSHPLTSLYSLQVQPPTLTSWVGTIIISLYGGATLPTLHFHDDESKSTVLDQDRRAQALGVGGGRTRGPMPLAPSWGGEAFLSQIKAQVRLLRSELDPTVYLVNPSSVDLEAHTLGKAYSDDAVPNEALKGVRGRIGEGQRGARQRDQAKTSILHQSSPVSSSPASNDWPDSLDAPSRSGSPSGGMDNLTFSVLSGFSRITRSARNYSQQAASTVLSHPLAKPLAKHVPKPIAQFAFAPGEIASLAESAGVGVYDGARVYLAKWARIVAEEGERARKAEYGVDDSSLLEDELGETGVFEVLSKTYHIARARTTRAPKTPISLEEWHAWFNPSTGQLLVSEPEAKRRIFQRGLVDDDCRKEVWPFLLGVYGWESTKEERKQVAEQKSAEYEKAKRSWMDDDELHKTERFLEEDHRVEIDCRRTDRTHPMFATPDPVPGAPLPEDDGRAHPPSTPHVRATHDVLMTWVFATPPTESAPSAASPIDPTTTPRAYVQGMSDLFSPLYVVLDGEQWLAYSCFETVMERNSDNFRMDQLGMKKQLSELQSLIRVMDRGLYRHFEQTNSLNLFFAYRWLLTCYKREFTFEDTVKLWEVFFTDHLGKRFHLFFALAILEANREVMIRYLREFDEILKYTVELSGTLDLQTLLSDAEVLYLTFKQIVANATPNVAESAVEGGGIRRRRISGQFPPTEEDKEEAKRDKVRERTTKEVDELRELLE
ncbi:GTPase-activating protein GYP7 [Sporobolomyces salmoneus]|uniref:GTPase-activating protein GYP7 n=1 Tax=Sporobolomyces salmoneus TaxID=183962 RepID=UPI0031726C0B